MHCGILKWEIHANLTFQSEFGDLGNSFLKSMVMMVGELDFGGIFHGENSVRFTVLSQFCFISFALIVTTVLMNLLVSKSLKYYFNMLFLFD